MKHDIIDRNTGNIVGVISLCDSESLSMLLDDINHAHRRIKQLEERLGALENRYFIEHDQ